MFASGYHFSVPPYHTTVVVAINSWLILIVPLIRPLVRQGVLVVFAHVIAPGSRKGYQALEPQGKKQLLLLPRIICPHKNVGVM